MVQWMDRNSAMCSQMGGEGVPWIGSAPYTERKHIFANLGDGTYFHSGTLAIRAAVAANVNITYKILYNDAVAMTGGQPMDGEIPVSRVAQQVIAEGVKKCWIVTEFPENYKNDKNVPAQVEVLDRKWMDKVQLEAREIEGCTIIIYDQTCAAEKRRRRKRGKYPDPAKRVMINSAVCEGCGDCSSQSNCVAVMPIETEYGRKRTINQSSCNKDFSCVKGFCPSFVTVYGGEPRKTEADNTDNLFDDLPAPVITEPEHAYNIIVTGIGGTGVLTISSVLGMAAHLEKKFSRNLDITGLAQKNGEVLSHVRISPTMDELRTGHIITGGTHLLLACDIVSAVGKSAHETLNPDLTKAVVNKDNTPVTEFVVNNKMDFHNQQVEQTLIESVIKDDLCFVDATTIARTLLGDEIMTNMFMLGYAWQKGLVPLQLESLMKALEINGVAIDGNKNAFNFGRLAVHDPDKIAALVDATKNDNSAEEISQTLAQIIEKRTAYLEAYQNKKYAQRYTKMLEKIRDLDKKLGREDDLLTEIVAKNYHKLLAYKDEYEVARLYTNGDFLKQLKSQFSGDYKIAFNLSPPLLSKTDPATGRPAKKEFGPWMMQAFKLLAKLKGLRGTPLDIFGYTSERKMERTLIKEYEDLIKQTITHANEDNIDIAVALLQTPDEIRLWPRQRQISRAYSRKTGLYP